MTLTELEQIGIFWLSKSNKQSFQNLISSIFFIYTTWDKSNLTFPSI